MILRTICSSGPQSHPTASSVSSSYMATIWAPIRPQCSSILANIFCRFSNVPRAAIYSGPNRRLCLIPTPPTSETAHALASGLWSPLERESRGQAEQRSRSDQHSERLGSSPLPPTRACSYRFKNGAALTQPLVSSFAKRGRFALYGAPRSGRSNTDEV